MRMRLPWAALLGAATTTAAAAAPFASLNSSCYNTTVTTGASDYYLYSACPFVSTGQEENYYGTWRNGFSLGTFTGYNGTVQYFGGGTGCTSPSDPRTSPITFVCGSSTALVSVNEGPECHYSFQVSTPEACCTPNCPSPTSAVTPSSTPPVTATPFPTYSSYPIATSTTVSNPFPGLYGQCFNWYSAYTYTSYQVCPFSNATQQTATSGNFYLGDYAGGSSTNVLVQNQYFSSGTWCNVANTYRSATLSFVCGGTNALLSVAETQTCKYAMQMSSPYACCNEQTCTASVTPSHSVSVSAVATSSPAPSTGPLAYLSGQCFFVTSTSPHGVVTICPFSGISLQSGPGVYDSLGTYSASTAGGMQQMYYGGAVCANGGTSTLTSSTLTLTCVPGSVGTSIISVTQTGACVYAATMSTPGACTIAQPSTASTPARAAPAALSSGAVAGIALGVCLPLCALLSCFIVWSRRRSKRFSELTRGPPSSASTARPSGVIFAGWFAGQQGEDGPRVVRRTEEPPVTFAPVAVGSGGARMNGRNPVPVGSLAAARRHQPSPPMSPRQQPRASSGAGARDIYAAALGTPPPASSLAPRVRANGPRAVVRTTVATAPASVTPDASSPPGVRLRGGGGVGTAAAVSGAAATWRHPLADDAAAHVDVLDTGLVPVVPAYARENEAAGVAIVPSYARDYEAAAAAAAAVSAAAASTDIYPDPASSASTSAATVSPTSAASAARLASVSDRTLLGTDDILVPCTICLSECDTPVTTPCAHNFCLECLASWIRAERERGNRPMCPMGRCGPIQGSPDALHPNLDLQRAQEATLALRSRLLRKQPSGEQ